MAAEAQRVWIWSAMLALATLTAPVQACDIPVFQYALEFWRADPYEAIVFYRGEMPPAADRALALLYDTGTRSNLLVREVGLADESAPVLADQPTAGQPLPWMVLRYPVQAEERRVVWAGPLKPDAIEAIIDSPARRQIVEALVKRKAGVWVLLSSGDGARDRSARAVLDQELARLERTLELPVNAPDQAPISFAVIEVNREDPRERAFVHMLLGSESDLAEQNVPMVFPIYGRGLVLYALVGDGINEWTIGEAAEFLVGPCSCQARSQNPGLELLISTDWNSQVEVTVADVFSAGSLAGFSDRAERAERMLMETGPAPAATRDGEDRYPKSVGIIAVLSLFGVGVALAAALIVLMGRKGAARI